LATHHKLTCSSTTLLESGELLIPEVKARQQAEFSLPQSIFSHTGENETFLTISFRLRAATSWADASHEVAWWQHKLPSPATAQKPLPSLESRHTLQVQDSNTSLQISGSSWTLDFDRARGYLTSWQSAGHTLLQQDPRTSAAIIPSFWRAPTDNDVPISLPYWRRFGLDDMTSQLRSLSVQSSEETGEVVVKTSTYLSPPVLAWGYNATTTYTAFPNGSLAVKVKLEPTGSYPKTIPRVGLELHLPKALDEATWFGPGPGESYPDSRRSQKVGIWSKTVAELQTNYEVPQENSNRMDTRWLTISESGGSGISVTGGTTSDGTNLFKWAAGRQTAATLEAARHPCDLVEEDATLLRLDAEVAGVGSAACGPGVREEFEVKCRDIEFEFVLRPVGV